MPHRSFTSPTSNNSAGRDSTAHLNAALCPPMAEDLGSEDTARQGSCHPDSSEIGADLSSENQGAGKGGEVPTCIHTFSKRDIDRSIPRSNLLDPYPPPRWPIPRRTFPRPAGSSHRPKRQYSAATDVSQISSGLGIDTPDKEERLRRQFATRETTMVCSSPESHRPDGNGKYSLERLLKNEARLTELRTVQEGDYHPGEKGSGDPLC